MPNLHFGRRASLKVTFVPAKGAPKRYLFIVTKRSVHIRKLSTRRRRGREREEYNERVRRERLEEMPRDERGERY